MRQQMESFEIWRTYVFRWRIIVGVRIALYHSSRCSSFKLLLHLSNPQLNNTTDVQDFNFHKPQGESRKLLCTHQKKTWASTPSDNIFRLNICNHVLIVCRCSLCHLNRSRHFLRYSPSRINLFNAKSNCLWASWRHCKLSTDKPPGR